MSGYLLDTDTITLVQYGQANVMARLTAHPASSIYISTISLQEQMRGWLARLPKLRGSAQVADWHNRLATRFFPVWRSYVLLPFTLPAITRFDQLRTLKLNVAAMDLRISALALEHGLTVVTRNLSDFSRVPVLSSEDWSV